MHPDPPHGNVLVLVEEADAGDLLGRAIAATGERPFVVKGGAKIPLASQHAETVDLVVTDLPTDGLAARSILKSLLAGEIFPSAPRIHLFRPGSAAGDPGAPRVDSAALSMPFPPDPAEFQVRVRLAAEIGRLRRELARTATRDPITGLSNRRSFLERLEEEFARARRYGTPLSLVLFDIDRLGTINHAFGHTTGDSVVQQFAGMVRAEVRREDLAGRLAGGILAVLMPGNGIRGAATFASKVRTDAEGIVLQQGEEVHQVRISAGITTVPDSAPVPNVDRLVRCAERALAEAKARGGNRVFIDEEVLRHERRVVLIADPDPELLDLAEDLLTLDDYQVVRAESARTALETLRFRRPDLLVVDLHMADRQGGPPLIEQIQSLFPSAEFPIIGLSSDTRTSPDRLARLGVDRFITKPFSVSLLRGAARELLQRTRAS